MCTQKLPGAPQQPNGYLLLDLPLPFSRARNHLSKDINPTALPGSKPLVGPQVLMMEPQLFHEVLHTLGPSSAASIFPSLHQYVGHREASTLSPPPGLPSWPRTCPPLLVLRPRSGAPHLSNTCLTLAGCCSLCTRRPGTSHVPLCH